MHCKHWDALELGPFGAQGFSRNTGNPENRWDDREVWKHQDPWGSRGAPGGLGCLGRGSAGMRRCGLKAPPRGSRGELPGEARDTRESPGARAGHGASQHPGKHGAAGIPGWNESPRSRNHLGWDGPASRPTWHGNTTIPENPANHPGKSRSAAGMGGFWEGLMLMHGM